MNSLSVILITKNQEWNIARLIESVLEAVGDMPVEIVLVDSASTDQTVETASSYPIGVLRLSSDQRLTPAIGRYVGYKNTTGEFVLFLDGDMALCRDWLEKGMEALRTRPEVSVVSGHVIDLPLDADHNDAHPLSPSTYSEALSQRPHVGGAAMYRRSVLEQIGTFNPSLYSDEEPELCLRIRRAGYQVCRIDYPIVNHFTAPSSRVSTVVGRWRRRLYLGPGQIIRYHLGSRFLPAYLKERGFGIIPLFGLLASGVTLFWALESGHWPLWLGGWAALLAVLVLAHAVQNRNLNRTFSIMIQRFFMMDGIVRGFFLRAPSLDDFSPAYKILKPTGKNAEKMASSPNFPKEKQ